jgi:aminopeptidase YwaD
MNKKLKIISLILIFLLSIFILPNASSGVEDFIIDPYWKIASLANGDSAFKYVEKLTTVEFEGRQSGTSGCDKAANWIADEFRTFGLEPYSQDSYLQSLNVPYFNLINPLTFRYNNGITWINPIYRKDFIVYPYSGNGKTSSKIVFAGYGITSKNQNYDDFEGIDVKDKAVLILYSLPSFILDTDIKNTLVNRIINSFHHGASSVILIINSENELQYPFNKFIFKWNVQYNADSPVILASSELSSALIELSNHSIKELIDNIEKSKKPNSFIIHNDIEIEVKSDSETRVSNNVIGYIPAIDKKVKDSILITSHYDALGIDHILNTVYYGANDNASSTGCIMEIARILMKKECLPSINVVFIAFTGEEEGLIGSRYYVENPLFPLDKIKAVINMEEVGTIPGDNIAGTSRTIYPDLSKLISSCVKYMKDRIVFRPEFLYPGSDHYPFHENDIPSVCFAKLTSTGYPEYHTTDDTIKIINPKSLEFFCQLISLMSLSYSKASYFDFSILQKEEKIQHPFIVWKDSCFIPDEGKLDIYINNQILFSDLKNKYDVYFPLVNGNNKLSLEVRYKNRILTKYDSDIFCLSNGKLRVDFNMDNKIDINDLIIFSKYLDVKAYKYQYISLFDLNSDQIVDNKDNLLFNEYFGYNYTN